LLRYLKRRPRPTQGCKADDDDDDEEEEEDETCLTSSFKNVEVSTRFLEDSCSPVFTPNSPLIIKYKKRQTRRGNVIKWNITLW
jgi:hypothetical protein